MSRQSGFTLVEALVAIVVLAFGLMAVTNLVVVAGMSNSVANRATAAAGLAARQVEMLKAVPFTALVPGGDLATDVGTPGAACTAAVGTYACTANVAGLGDFRVRWRIQPAVGAPSTLFIAVRVESAAPMLGARTRAEYTTFRVSS